MGTAHLLLALFAIQYVAAQRGRLPDIEDMEDSQSQIINGQDADQGEYPFMVRWAAYTGQHVCGGSLISPRIVLTAAHCVVFEGAKVPVQLARAVVGDHTTNKTEEHEQALEVMRIIVHEDYHLDPIGLPYNDVALIVLKEEVTLVDGVVNTIALPQDDSFYEEGTAVTVIGWGVDDDEGELSPAETLQELEYEIANEEECKQHWEEDYKKYEDEIGLVDYEMNMDEKTEFTFCTIDPAREATAFSGDSGGPLFVKDGDAITQIGVVSWAEADPKVKTYNMFMDVYHYVDWIKNAMERANQDSWLELHTGASHGMVMVHNNMGHVTTMCNDNVGKDEANAICREQGYTMGTLADVRDYQSGGRGRKNQDAEFPPYGHTNLNCDSEAAHVMSDCAMDEYKDAKVPCFDGQQLAVQCADKVWSFKTTHMIPQTKSVRGTPFVRGRVMCEVHAQKYGVDLDMKSQVQVGLVIRGQEGLDEIIANMKYKKKMNTYVAKFRPTDEIKADDCFACIAYLPGTTIYTVATLGPEDCPDNDAHYEEWVAKQSQDEEHDEGEGGDEDDEGEGDDGGEEGKGDGDDGDVRPN